LEINRLNAYFISGSPNIAGSTIAILKMLAMELKKLGFSTEIEILDNCKINYCKGCKKCESDQKCFQRDDMDLIIDKIKYSDLLVLASPSYWGDITGQMKVFIDRCTPLCEYINKQAIPKGKLGISISIRAGKMEQENTHILECFEHFFNHLGIKPIERFSLTQVSKRSDLEKKMEELSKLKNIAITVDTEFQKDK
jgi:multimeric flavodoxin WrbA